MSIVSKKAIRDPKLRWFPRARFGMFVHFGIYAVLGRGEWVQYEERIPRKEYEKRMRRFHPFRFDADAWVDLAEKAGCQYITFTTKHHDGFCMFDSNLTDYKITNTPFGRDLTGELIDACHRRGMRVLLYYSQPDWHHPNFVHLPGAFKDLDHVPLDQQPDWAKYLEYYHGQVEELCTQYGKIDGIWFDGSHKSEKMWQGRRIYRLIKKYQPDAVVNDRARCGDFFTPERSLPEDLGGYLFESCQSVSKNHWGYCKDSPQYSVPNLIENLVRVVSEGGNFLLNVGPLPDGTIPEYQADRMRAIGTWLSVCGEAIYGTEKGRIETGASYVLSTRKDTTMYLLLCRWPETDRIMIPGIRTCPRSAHLLRGGEALETKITDAGLEIGGLPMLPADCAVNVIRLRFRAMPTLKRAKCAFGRSTTIRLRERTMLSVGDAQPDGLGIKGQRLRITDRTPTEVERERGPVKVVSNWSALEQRLVWRIDAPQEGKYRVRVQLSCPKPYHGSAYILKSKVDSVTGTVNPSPSFDEFCWQTLGCIRLPKGKSRLILQPTEMPYGYIFAHVAAIDIQRGP